MEINHPVHELTLSRKEEYRPPKAETTPVEQKSKGVCLENTCLVVQAFVGRKLVTKIQLPKS